MTRFTPSPLLHSRIAQLLIHTARKWQQDNCLEMGAALSYYALFSLVPIFLVILSVLGIVVGPDIERVNYLLRVAEQVLPPLSYQIVQDTLFRLNYNSVRAGIAGFVIVLFTASNVFGALDRSVDRIWKVEQPQHQVITPQSKIITFLQNKLLAFSLVLSVAILMVLSFTAHVGLKILQRMLESLNHSITFIQLDDVVILRSLHVSGTFLALNLIVILLFKILPSTRVRWNDVWLGAFVTTSLLTALQEIVSNSVIHIGTQYRSYGLLGSVMVLLFWIYLICQIFLIGSEFTYIYAYLFGSRRNR